MSSLPADSRAPARVVPAVRRHRSSPWLRSLPATALLLDTAAVVVAGLVAVEASAPESVALPGLMGVVVLAAVASLGGFRPDVFVAGTDGLKRVLHGALLAAGLTGVGCYVTGLDLSRAFFLVALAVGVPLLLAGRLTLRAALHRAHRRGALQQQVVIAGPGHQVDEIARVLRRESWLGYRVVGAVTPVSETAGQTSYGVPVLGDLCGGVAQAARVGADVLVVAGGGVSDADAMRSLVWQAEEASVQVVVAPSVTEISSERVRVRPVGGLPLVHIDPPTWTDATRWGKRTFDVVGSLLAMLALAPVVAVAAARVRLHDGGPVLFGHTRIGRHGEPFRCLKLRTMVVDAEAMAERLRAESGGSPLLWKDRDDPRVTRPGRWLRRFSVDELPQLVNVLRGQMSLVGPRPQVAAEVELYDGPMARRLHVRPGMTGLWQVSGRNDLTLEDAARLDLYYVDNWSMLQDLTILARTLSAVLRSKGAY